MRDLAIIFSALADPTRLEMLALLLRNDELCVCDFVETLGISQSKASRHLRYMWNARLLEDRRSGLWVYYRISPSMEGDRQMLVAALSKVFAGRDLAELEARLSSWFKRKTKTIACAVSPPRKAAVPTVARARKARRAQEARR